ncbi:uncharacterized protein LOC120071839 [Benincasa hispida]|uniref:uncharacterized protein LOC120071839 n=1 Tax=Benincasa hispida TaxID=102211 RepID=UPI00190103D2|nr:uncharacterized protein LOC120071839 [Benincasa hispida]
MRCPEEQKLQCAAFVLIDNAKCWWRLAERMIETSGGRATWDQFKEQFYEKYFSAHVRYNKQAEFMNLKQGTMTVEEYEEKFTRLSCFAPDLVSTEAKRAERFVQGLRDEVRGIVQALEPPNYATAFRAAARVGYPSGIEFSKSLTEEPASGQKRKVEQKALGPSQKVQSTDRSQGHAQRHATASGGVWRERPVCKSCGKHHWGYCLIGTGTCFK